MNSDSSSVTSRSTATPSDATAGKRREWKPLRRWLLASVLTCLITGFWVFSLVGIPFGSLFTVSLYCCIASTLSLLSCLAVLCFTAHRRWVRPAGGLPAILCIGILSFTTVISLESLQGKQPALTQEQWKEDLYFLANQLQSIHPDPYGNTSEEEFTATVKEIEAKITEMSATEMLMQLFRLTALPNDGHTAPAVMLPPNRFHSLPIRIYRFTDGWYVVDAGRSHRHLIGDKMVAIGSTDINDIFTRSSKYVSAQSSTALLPRFAFLGLIAEWLHSQGIVEDIRKVPVTLEKPDGEQVSLTMPVVWTLSHFYWYVFRKVDNRQSAVFENIREEIYWMEVLEASNTLYIQCNQMDAAISEFAMRLSELINAHSFDRCVIDLRTNLGGDDRHVWKFVEVIRESEKINKKGKLFVLIGRHTFSSGVVCAHMLQLQTKAVFIGEPTADGPIFSGNPRLVALPNSGLELLISTTSTARTQAEWPFTTAKEIRPDILVQYSHDDFRNARDPVLDAALKHSPAVESRIVLRTETMDSYTGRYMLSPDHVLEIERHDATLELTINDSNPKSLFRVHSGLYPVTENDFNTDIANVQLHFSPDSGPQAGSVRVDWMGEERVLLRE